MPMRCRCTREPAWTPGGRCSTWAATWRRWPPRRAGRSGPPRPGRWPAWNGSGPGPTGRPITRPGPAAPGGSPSAPSATASRSRPAPWPARERSTASSTWRWRRAAGMTGPGTPSWPCWPAWTRPAAGRGSACPPRTRRPGRCSWRAGTTTSWTCTWRPSRDCLTRAGPSPPPPPPDPAPRGGDRPLLAGQVGRAAAQHVLLDLAGRGLGQLGHEAHPVRGLEVRQAAAGERDDLLLARLLPVAEHHERVRRLAPLLVRQPDDRHLHHRRVAQQDALDLQRGDVLAAADDHVLDPVTDLRVAVRVQHSGIAGVEPAVAHRPLGRLGVVVVAVHHHVAAHHDLAERLAVRGHLHALLIHHPQLAR